jgi:hypothetical protein
MKIKEFFVYPITFTAVDGHITGVLFTNSVLIDQYSDFVCEAFTFTQINLNLPVANQRATMVIPTFTLEMRENGREFFTTGGNAIIAPDTISSYMGNTFVLSEPLMLASGTVVSATVSAYLVNILGGFSSDIYINLIGYRLIDRE